MSEPTTDYDYNNICNVRIRSLGARHQSWLFDVEGECYQYAASCHETVRDWTNTCIQRLQYKDRHREVVSKCQTVARCYHYMPVEVPEANGYWHMGKPAEQYRPLLQQALRKFWRVLLLDGGPQNEPQP